VVAVIVTCRLYLGLRIFTAICVGVTIGWIFSGILLTISHDYIDLNSERLAERRATYVVLSFLTLLLSLFHLAMSANREYRRRRS
jgi:cytochrome bd-type quinol oxidase subunit 2